MAEQSLKNIAKSKFAVAIYAICLAVLLVFGGSVFHVLNNASNIADKVQIEAEQSLVQAEISRQMEILAFDQSQISHWDDSVTALYGKIDQEFVREEIAEWLWEDFDIRGTVVVGTDGEPRVTVFEDRVFAPEAGRVFTKMNMDLVSQAADLYMDNRVKRQNGYSVAEDPTRRENPLYVADIRMARNELSIVVAQAIVPDDSAVIDNGRPQVLLVFKPLTEEVFNNIGSKLGLIDFRIKITDNIPDSFNGIELGNSNSGITFQALWQPKNPSSAIWDQSVPIIIALVLLVGFALFYTAIRYSRALAALEVSEAKNRFLALHDPLTGLPNRLQFDRELEQIISEKKQDSCAVLCADMDRFKSVNDTYGHQAGDAVIKTIAERISKAVGDNGMAARIGGDEFIILLKDQLDRDSVLFLCDGIIEKVCEEVFFEGGSAFVGMSIGVAWWPDDALTAKNIIRSADEALYRAKEAGRGQACTSDDRIRDLSQDAGLSTPETKAA